MTEGAGPPLELPKATLPTISDTRFGFLTQEWVNPPESVFYSLRTAEEQHRLLADDDAYRQTVSPPHGPDTSIWEGPLQTAFILIESGTTSNPTHLSYTS
ncbi:hypothetical protein MHU86_25269 [Fragilaria crotonensis]|nr:hypothetical protein MHU86_25269 [Fragilaria crotonensis]